MVAGVLSDIQDNLEGLDRALACTGGYEAVFRGHTHERMEERVGGTLLVNPGEVLGWKGPATVALHDTATGEVEFVAL